MIQLFERETGTVGQVLRLIIVSRGQHLEGQCAQFLPIHMGIERTRTVRQTRLSTNHSYLFVREPGVSVHFTRIDPNRHFLHAFRRTHVYVHHDVMTAR